MNTRMCFKKTGEPRKGIHPRYLKCREKVCYRYLRDAGQAADRYVDRISVLMAPMVPYFCPAHRCWHIGHDKKMKRGPARDYEWMCIKRQKLREEIRCLSEVLALI